MSNYRPTIGLEIHAELKTHTKMFCDSLNDPDEKHPNVNVCPVCLSHPGTLPTINKQAVEHVIKVGLALGGKINPVSKFDRKNYFYPDLPKGYQISQYDQPLVLSGELNGVRIRRIHLEEDTGTLIHDEKTYSSLVDFNRAGVPLMELVTEPDVKSADETIAFAKELQLILRYLGVSDADMEKGQMRIEANVSINMGTKTELKNINSFRFAREAIEYEIKRQKEALEKGGEIEQETRGWDENKKRTVSQRTKEEAHDYRYFPEPDLPPFETSVFGFENLKISIPELPKEKRTRLASEYSLNEKQVGVLVEDMALAEYFEEAVSELKALSAKADPKAILNYLTSDLMGLINAEKLVFADLKIEPEHLAHLVFLIESGKIGSRQAKDILAKMFETGLDPEEILTSEGLHTISDEAELIKVVQEVIKENPSAVADYKKGKTASLQFLVGQAMAKLKGRGNPEVLAKIFEKNL
ncbi:MAG: Asp-tRNA(Asn)/Glu-tRNA(Gln) amidotransferase subunit GatB [Candidatus Liptonbacteria bacterium]|nr:Asp-tRNA(Asn)/Glu-tRNA(Gln) amidotransferase subunit GatB [Candidatus Liptonbacteria bacterium]